VDETDDMLVARRGRLLRRVRAWDDEAAREFGDDCIRRARELAAEALGRAGLERERAALESADELGCLQAVAAAEAQNATGAAADALVFLADAIQVSRGGWFEVYAGHPGAGATATAGAIAANIGFVVATAAGGVAADAAGDPAAFEGGWESERARQLDWLTARLELEDL
jgi:hypothetical protein